MVQKLLQNITGNLHFRSGKIENVIFIAGSGRSGTTWISDIINYDNNYRYIFEPIHNKKIKLFKDFNYRQYLRPDSKENKYLKPIKSILDGDIRSYWADHLNKKIFYNKILIKDIRANLFLKWLKNNFPDVPIIYILRNPCAVANSKIKLNWDTHLDIFLNQSELIEDYLSPYLDLIKNTKDIFEKHIIMWCIENYIPLRQLKEKDFCLVKYEDLCLNTSQEINKIFKYLNKECPENIISRTKLPSALSRKDSAINLGISLTDSWKKDISPDQVKRAKQILKLFNLEKFL